MRCCAWELPFHALPHCSHTHGRFPLWNPWNWTKVKLRLKALPHFWHWCGFSQCVFSDAEKSLNCDCNVCPTHHIYRKPMHLIYLQMCFTLRTHTNIFFLISFVDGVYLLQEFSLLTISFAESLSFLFIPSLAKFPVCLSNLPSNSQESWKSGPSLSYSPAPMPQDLCLLGIILFWGQMLILSPCVSTWKEEIYE